MHFYYAFPTVDRDEDKDAYVFVNALHIVRIDTVGSDGKPGKAIPMATLTDGSKVFFDDHAFKLLCRDHLVGE